MIAILLCAGYAIRMYPITKSFPKPRNPVTKPFVKTGTQIIRVRNKCIEDPEIKQLFQHAGCQQGGVDITMAGRIPCRNRVF